MLRGCRLETTTQTQISRWTSSKGCSVHSTADFIDHKLIKANMQYAALDHKQKQTRVLHLQPALYGTDNIVCHFSTVLLDNKNFLQYEALSYVWGDCTHDIPIYLEGIPRTVTKNLYQALVNLRFKDRKRIIWVDALCIDQSNPHERNHQVAQMHSIYSQAINVVIWLGEPSSDIELVLGFLQFHGHGHDLHILPTFAFEKETWIRNDAPGRLLLALKRFIRLPWFTRIWTVQEWALARATTIHCGKYEIDGELLNRCAENVTRHALTCCREGSHPWLSPTLDSLFRPIGTIEALRNGKVDFLSTLSELRSRDSSDPRDKLYGLLALADHKVANLLQPDYTLTVEQVYEAWTVSHIESTKNLDILSQILPHKAPNLKLPSFVPDWTARYGNARGVTESIWLLRLSQLSMYNACGGLEAMADATPGRLNIHGAIVDTIETVTLYETGTEAMFDETYELAGLFTRARDLNSDGTTQEEAYWLTLCGGIQPNQHTKSFSRTKHILNVSAAEKWLVWRSAYDEPPPNSDLAEMDALFEAVSSGRSFTITTARRMGFVPVNAVVGDVVAILSGGSVPMVLRPNDQGYTIVGDAYIHGIMDGEALKTVERLEELIIT
jgi:hypothetical protein